VFAQNLLESGKYESVEAFEEDMRLVFSNCLAYWGPKHNLSLMAMQLEKEFELCLME
jgi:hypothetical protein